jgi:hypothetical protein
VTLLSTLIASVTFTAFHLGRGTLAPISSERPPDVVLRLGELAALSADISFVAFVRFDKCARHGSVPEEQEQNDDRNWNAEQPEKYSSTHCSGSYGFN